MFLSHNLSNTTPLYGGAKSIKIYKKSSIHDGDSANSLSLIFPNHSGTHVDVPYHFFDDGKKLTDYDASFWIFSHPVCIDVPSEDGYLVKYEDIVNSIKEETDLLLIRTGYEKHRNNKTYWQKNPGLSVGLASKLRSNHKNIRALGIDVISITSRLHRKEGRKAHQELLGSHYDSQPIVLVEDMSLIKYNGLINKVFIIPLMIKDSDGAPCTVLALR